MTRSVLTVASGSLVVLLLAACGSKQGKFGDEFVTKYCDAYDACDRLGRPCPVELEDAGSVYKDCDFDKDLAETCLAASYTCDDTIPENAVLIVPEACMTVCGDVLLPGSE